MSSTLLSRMCDRIVKVFSMSSRTLCIESESQRSKVHRQPEDWLQECWMFWETNTIQLGDARSEMSFLFYQVYECWVWSKCEASWFNTTLDVVWLCRVAMSQPWMSDEVQSTWYVIPYEGMSVCVDCLSCMSLAQYKRKSICSCYWKSLPRICFETYFSDWIKIIVGKQRKKTKKTKKWTFELLIRKHFKSLKTLWFIDPVTDIIGRFLLIFIDTVTEDFYNFLFLQNLFNIKLFQKLFVAFNIFCKYST